MSMETAMSGLSFRNPVLIVLAIIFVHICGCATEPVLKKVEICAGKKDIAEAVETLRLQHKNASPIRASGNLTRHKDRLDITLVARLPDHLYLRANIFGTEAIALGTNNEEFWFRIKPMISTYWWGQSDRSVMAESTTQRCLQQILPISPYDLLDALGGAGVDNEWELSNEGNFDVFTKKTGDKPAKRMYVNNCDYLVRKIENFDDNGQISAVIGLNDYVRTDNITVPTTIAIECPGLDDTDSTVSITLKNVRSFDMSPAKFERIFARPEPKGFTTILKLDDKCSFIRQ